jgi:PAS domain S-box-containing protein
MELASKILLLNNKPELARTLQGYLLKVFEQVDCLHETSRAISPLAGSEYDLLVLSNHLNDMEGIDFVRWLRKEGIEVPFIMIAGDSDIRQAVDAMKEGAMEFLQWSDDTDALLPYIAEVVRKALYQYSKNRLVSESERLYNTLFENIRDAVFVHFVDENTRQPGCFIEVNEVACRRLGYSKQAFFSMTPYDIDVPGSVEMQDIVDELYAKGSVIFKSFHRAKDGRHIPVEINSRVFDLKGRKTVLSVARNITDQQEFMAELRKSESRFRSIIEKCIIGICITDENGFFEYVNDAYCKIYSYKPEEMLGKHFAMVAASQNKQLLMDLHDEFILTGENVKTDWTVLDRYGNEKYVVADAARIVDANGRYRKVTFVEDVTAEKRAKEALTLSEVKYRTMMENLQDPIFISDSEFRIIYVNKAYRKRFGDVKKHEKCYKHVFGQKDPCPWCMASIENMSRFRKRLEKTINRRVYQITTVPIHFEQVYNAKMTILRDITKVVKARRKAEESDRLKSAFLANISHEIRTPLNAVLGFSSLLKDEGITRDETLMYVDMINESSSHLMHVMDDVIEFSFVDSGLIKVNAMIVSTKELFESLYKETLSMQEKLGKQDLQITFQNQVPPVIKLISDEARVRQILLNLLSNALKFTERGSISLTVSYRESKWLVFSVRDTGIGIPKRKHNVIFRRFRQVDEGNTRMFGGNGMGLALCKHLTQMLGGYIQMDSAPGRGSEFRLYLPEKLDEELARALSVDVIS